jgi:hypothetical protein
MEQLLEQSGANQDAQTAPLTKPKTYIIVHSDLVADKN